MVWTGIACAKLASRFIETKTAIKREITIAREVVEQPKEEQKQEVPVPPTEEAIKEIAKKPPKYTTSGKITGSTQTNSDGSKTVVVSTGTATPQDFSKVPDQAPDGSFAYIDETGKYAYLASIFRGYIRDQLKTSSEFGYLSQIIVRDAGDTGWSGQYNGTYTINSSGDIVSAYGFIILNVYAPYYNSNQSLLQDYLKLTLAHEYGHHYTLYHRWVDLDIPVNQRFPDEYYNLRPLSKTTTAIDYSKDWENCDAEIIAEDYSYFYSGYGIQQMNLRNGLDLPSASTKTWLANMTNNSTPAPAPLSAPVVDNAPSVSVVSPLPGSISNGFIFKADASDDIGIKRIDFYIDASLVSSDSSSPYQVDLMTGSYSDGDHVLKAVAIDSANKNTESLVNVSFQNTIRVSFIAPVGNPYEWNSDDLIIRAKTDLGEVVKMEIYINGYLRLSENKSTIAASWPYDQGPAGTYSLKIRGYDKNGNYAESTIVINKH